jgi:hypothetical protein
LTLTGSSSLPSFLTFSVAPNEITFQTANMADAGTYSFTLTGVNYGKVSASVTWILYVNRPFTTASPNLPPFFINIPLQIYELTCNT